jgi:hypothetical protein
MFYCELLSGIWIGDTDILMNDNFLKDNNITIILNCTQLFDFPKNKDIIKIRLPFSSVRDSNTDINLLKNNKTKIISYIKEKIDTDNILICCYNGKSISPFIVALFMNHESSINKSSIYDILLSKCKDLELWYDLSVFD